MLEEVLDKNEFTFARFGMSMFAVVSIRVRAHTVSVVRIADSVEIIIADIVQVFDWPIASSIDMVLIVRIDKHMEEVTSFLAGTLIVCIQTTYC